MNEISRDLYREGVRVSGEDIKKERKKEKGKMASAAEDDVEVLKTAIIKIGERQSDGSINTSFG